MRCSRISLGVDGPSSVLIFKLFVALTRPMSVIGSCRGRMSTMSMGYSSTLRRMQSLGSVLESKLVATLVATRLGRDISVRAMWLRGAASCEVCSGGVGS